jgi:hypothetical protein
VSAADRRTVEELLADSDALARETLLDTTLEHAPAMVRSWNQLVESAANLWAVLPAIRSDRGALPGQWVHAARRAALVSRIRAW